MNRTIDKLKKEDVENYIREYISGYRTFLEEKYPHRKNDFPFYTDYPFDVKAYISDKSTLITHKHNASTLKIEVFEVDTLPDWKPLEKKLDIEVSSNAYLSRIINKPHDVAKRDILNVFSQEEHEKEQAEQYEELYFEAVENEINDTVEGYLKYLDNVHDVKKETLEKHRNDIYSAVQLVTKHDQYVSGFLIAGCETLENVAIELNKDIESSIFLSIHANYRAANTLLRRWLEVTFIALNFDFKLKRLKDKLVRYDKILKKRDKWLRTPWHISFTGEVLDTLLDPETNSKATQLLNMVKPDNGKSFEEHVKTIYRELNQHVHYGGFSPTPIDKLTFNFVEYDEISFIEWYNNLNHIYEICNIIILLKFPEMIALSEKNKYDYISFPTLAATQVSKLKEWQKSHTPDLSTDPNK